MKGSWTRRFAPYGEIVRAAWENRDRAGYALRILRDGVCDGCALGTSGLRDWTMDGIHLCWVRLNLLRLNTMPPMDEKLLEAVEPLRGRSEAELRGMGRLSAPLWRRPGESGFRRVSWDDALDLVAARLRSSDPRRIAFYVVSRGTVNETYYVAQKVARWLGTNNVDNSSRICHAPSTVALKESLGLAATTVSYRDLFEADLVVLVGSDPANNQPVLMKYIHLARKRGTRCVLINPFREPGLETYWVPSSLDSALLGTRICDAFYSIRVGGDIAFLNGVLKHLLALGALDRDFIARHTSGWDALERDLGTQSLPDLAAASGATPEAMADFARTYAGARRVIFVWSMGVTMHRHGVDNVRAIVNLALARGMIGRPGAGLMPIRGHSGVQGGAEMGCVPNQFPGGVPVDPAHAAELAAQWGFHPPAVPGYYAPEMVEAAHRGELDVLYQVGSNLLGVLPDPSYTAEALARVPLRVHHDIVVNPQMLAPAQGTVLLLPATTRYEMEGGNTQTSTERRVIFNPQVPGPRVPEARDEWRVLVDLARRVRPEDAAAVHFPDTAAIRAEIARVVPFYDGIQNLRGKGDQFQWGGARLGEGGQFGLPDGRARFAILAPPVRDVPPGWFQLTTRRGKQFNSMIFGGHDSLTGNGRDTVLLAPPDMARLGLAEGAPVLVRSKTGSLRGRVRTGALALGTVMLYWPEANVLVSRGVTDPRAGIPAYRDAVVEVLAEGGAPGGAAPGGPR